MPKTKTFEKKLLKSQRRAIDDFLNEMKANGLAKNTIRSYRKTLKKFVKFVDKPFKQVTKEEIIHIINEYRKTYAKATVNQFKIHIKRFYQWLYDMERGEYPDNVKQLKAKATTNDITKDQLLTEGELKSLIRHAGSSRNRALIATLWESAARPSELLSLNVGSVEATEYGFCMYIQESKTKVRNLPIIQTSTYLARWLEDHPYRDNPKSPLWISLGPKTYGEKLGYIGVLKILRNATELAGIKKKVSAKWLRHLRLTQLATKVKEQSLKSFAGWTRDSKMPKVYIHLNGEDTVNAILEATGVKTEETESKLTFERIICARCKAENPDTATYCTRCGAPLTMKLALASQPQQNAEIKRLREEVNNLRNLIIETGKIPLDFLQKAYAEYINQQEAERQEEIEEEKQKILRQKT